VLYQTIKFKYQGYIYCGFYPLTRPPEVTLPEDCIRSFQRSSPRDQNTQSSQIHSITEGE
jgi:hypothetical protein